MRHGEVLWQKKIQNGTMIALFDISNKSYSKTRFLNGDYNLSSTFCFHQVTSLQEEILIAQDQCRELTTTLNENTEQMKKLQVYNDNCCCVPSSSSLAAPSIL